MASTLKRVSCGPFTTIASYTTGRSRTPDETEIASDQTTGSSFQRV